ncbi:MAG: flagellin [Brevundimonas sp.]|uniref:flagellin n=1 Tax=Brevundimonas sp. TaxID=1871086 RepID=UPI00391D75A0
MASINTNYGAMVAAQSLAATGRELANVQNRVTTGMKVSSAKDNGAVWAIATTQKANAKALDATINNLQRSQSINDVGLAAGETIMAALTEMKALGTAIEAATAAGSSTTAYAADFTALSGEITAAIAAANFDGVAAFGATPPAVPAAQTAAGVQTSIDAWASALQGLGTTSKSLERQITFNTKLQDALEAGAGNLVDADLAKESARLTALQTKQQLGVQALSIANSSSSILLGLFR